MRTFRRLTPAVSGCHTKAKPTVAIPLDQQVEALATERIDALMGRFNLGWGAVK